MQTRPQSWSTTSTTFTWTVGTCTSLVLLGDRLILIGLRYSLEMEVRRLNSVGAVVWTGALFLCSSVWRPSYCDCLISHRCECRRWSATLLRSLCDKQLPNKHIQSGAPISWSRRTGLKSSGGWGGGGVIELFTALLSFSLPCWEMQHRLYQPCWPWVTAHGGRLHLNDTVHIKRLSQSSSDYSAPSQLWTCSLYACAVCIPFLKKKIPKLLFFSFWQLTSFLLTFFPSSPVKLPDFSIFTSAHWQSVSSHNSQVYSWCTGCVCVWRGWNTLLLPWSKLSSMKIVSCFFAWMKMIFFLNVCMCIDG